ncbi:response regulator receiver modulated diguanylate cyclase/phosphodiesterase [Luminiphilus syltensis NOR5-1B]|uniref:Response regulator receiver modulated diguanylate cyclase/phosphodiesterase n=1 Tax=Luminiphilus syltensis NOR5-1B TaxID=565045 RepID=B8KWW4_9GAMM|nr:EAL domain-containing response regulator [Luminiphilus syltensis]EED36781.1 response regulator receiver modulated diguanylate cyclase/phosphodiesterase [Luminiphilus syltensis NOR5-1B]
MQATTPNRKASKILVCDDDLMVRVLARECLEAAGMDVIDAEDGIQALEAFQSELPDLVFLDVEMPGKTGLEVCAEIRALPQGMNVPVLIATGAEDADSIDRGFNAGATQYKTKPINWSLLSRDIRYMLRAAEAFNELKAQEDRLRYLAYFDHLTDLPNRRSFNEQLRRNLIDGHKRESLTGLIVIDVDHFKRINDSIGHERGDDLLRNMAVRIQDALTQIATIISDYPGAAVTADPDSLAFELARPGGDEFTVVVRNPASIEHLADIGNAIMESLNDPVEIQGHALVLTPSIGAAMAPLHGQTPELLLRHADAAMYAAKADGRARLRVYDESLEDDAELQLQLEEDLRDALDTGGLRMMYQPQIDTRTGEMCGVEALIRWQHPTLGAIPPDQFIGVAERTGLIRPLGDWILREVDADARKSGSNFPRSVSVSINLSPIQFGQSNFVSHLTQIIKQLDLNYTVELELTEGVVMTDAEHNLDKLRQLKALGFKLAIDDFGTGYSSLSYLRHFPIDTLKIDRSFINDIGTPDGDGIVRAILGLCHALDLTVVAEGVETKEQALFLADHGCQILQGFLLGRPMPVGDLMAASEQNYLPLITDSGSSTQAS